MQAVSAREAARRAGLEVDVVFAENNAIVQIHQIFARIHAPEAERPAVIIMQSVAGEGLERVARNAVGCGIGWILLNRRVGYVDDLRQLREDLPISSVTPDQAEIGRIHGRQARALMKGLGTGLLLYLQGPPDTSAAQDRLQGTQDVLRETGWPWKILNGDWTEASGDTAMSGWLRLKTSGGQKPALLIAQNDAMAVGARRAALRFDASWRQVPVIGCDGFPDAGQRLVNSGELAATVVLPLTAGPAVELAARWLAKGQKPSAETVLAGSSYPPEGQLTRR